MENKDMREKLENHEKRLTTVEILTEYQSGDIKSNKNDLSRLVTFQNRLQIFLAMCVGAYLGWDKILGMVGKFIGG